MKIAHLSDAHLGYNQYGLKERADDFASTWLWTCSEIADRKCDVVLIAGDLFNQRDIKPQTFREATLGLNVLRASNIPVYAIEGNHEQMRDGSDGWLSELHWLRYLHHLESGWGSVNDVLISGLNWSGSKTAEKIKSLKTMGKNHFLLLHAAYQPAINFPCAEEVSQELLQSLDVGYIAIGHIHRSFDDGIVHSTGSLETWSVTETEDPQRGFNIITWDNGWQVERVIPPRREWAFVTINLDGCKTRTAALDMISQIQPVYEDQILTVTLTGPDLGLGETEIRQALKHLNTLHIRVEMKTSKVIDFQKNRDIQLMVEKTSKPQETWEEAKTFVSKNTTDSISAL